MFAWLPRMWLLLLFSLALWYQWQCVRDLLFLFNSFFTRHYFYRRLRVTMIANFKKWSNFCGKVLFKLCLNGVSAPLSPRMGCALCTHVCNMSVCVCACGVLYYILFYSYVRKWKNTLSATSRVSAVRQFVAIVKIQRTSLVNDAIESINFYVKLVHTYKVYIQVKELWNRNAYIWMNVCVCLCAYIFCAGRCLVG